MYPWYDSWWLTDYTRARALLRQHRPAALQPFLHALKVFEAPPDFSPPKLHGVFDEQTLEEIRRTLAGVRPAELEIHEAHTFGRFVLRNHPYFTELHQSLIPFVSAAAGERVEPTYNFASMYGGAGVCPPHMDAPEAKWTLDLCLAQNTPWPIAFSQVVPWPEPGDWPDDPGLFEAAVKQSPALRFTPVTLEPAEAVLFSGSSQWHYRDRMPRAPGRQHCDLLFFHFVPEGTRDLVRAEHWARIFDAPELADLGDRDTGFI